VKPAKSTLDQRPVFEGENSRFLAGQGRDQSADVHALRLLRLRWRRPRRVGTCRRHFICPGDGGISSMTIQIIPRLRPNLDVQKWTAIAQNTFYSTFSRASIFDSQKAGIPPRFAETGFIGRQGIGSPKVGRLA
jgi:hypothetical protein